jgi:hypothetical protein
VTALVVIEGIVIVLLLVLVAGLLRSHADILRRLEALGAGEDVQITQTRTSISSTPTRTEPASLASISGPTPLGDTASVALTDSRGFVLLAFLSSGCSTCQTFWKSFRNGMELPGADIRPVIVTQGPESESPSEIRSRAPLDITTIMSNEAWDSFRVPGTPYFQLVDVERGLVIGEGSAGTWPRLMDLIQRSTGDATFNPIKLGTKQRQEDSDQALRDAGIAPGDPSMYRRDP